MSLPIHNIAAGTLIEVLNELRQVLPQSLLEKSGLALMQQQAFMQQRQQPGYEGGLGPNPMGDRR